MALMHRLSALARKTFGKQPFLASDEACRVYQAAAFARLGLDAAKARRRLDALLKELGKPPYDEAADSQHWMLFCAIAALDRPVKRVLEIGTYDGSFSRALTSLFPDAQIVTVDLKDDDPIILGSMGRKDRAIRENVVRQRGENLRAERITFIQANSFFLPQLIKEPFDLIWLDGDHHFPVLSWDFCNAYHLLVQNGILACDDVYLFPSSDALPTAHSKVVLEYLKGSGIFNMDFVLKRVAKGNSSDPAYRKYLGLLKKP